MKWTAALLLLACGVVLFFYPPCAGTRKPESGAAARARSAPQPTPGDTGGRVSVQGSVGSSAAVRATGATGATGMPASWVARNNRATELLGAGDLEGARRLFESCVAGEPSNAVFRANLAEALARLAREAYDRRELEEALEKLERAQHFAPEREDLVALEKRWRLESEVEESHWSEGSDLFELSYDTRRDELLQNSQTVLDHLERAYERLRLWFGVDPVRELGRARIRVVLYRAEEFDRLTGLGDWAGGVFDGVVRIAVGELLAQEQRWSRVLTHELAHAFLHELGGREVPGWLNEGLSQLLESYVSGDSAAADVEAARRRMGVDPFPLDRLRASLAGWEDAEEIARAYAQSLAFVAFLRRDYGDEALRQMVIQRGSGVPVAQSFERWTSVPLEFAFEAFAR